MDKKDDKDSHLDKLQELVGSKNEGQQTAGPMQALTFEDRQKEYDDEMRMMLSEGGADYSGREQITRALNRRSL